MRLGRIFRFRSWSVGVQGFVTDCVCGATVMPAADEAVAPEATSALVAAAPLCKRCCSHVHGHLSAAGAPGM